MLHGAWPPLPIDEWWHGPGARVSDRDALVKKWTRGLNPRNDEGWTPPKKKEAPKANKKKKIEAKPKKDKKDKDKKEKASLRPKDANNANVGAKEGQRSTPNVTEASGTAKASGAMETSASTSTTVQASAPAEEVMSPCSCVCICLYIWLQCAFTTSKHAAAIVCGGTS